jgi:hypothetical protein
MTTRWRCGVVSVHSLGPPSSFRFPFTVTGCEARSPGVARGRAAKLGRRAPDPLQAAPPARTMPGAMLSRLAAPALAAAGLGCNNLGHYSTAPGESYCGTVTASATFRTGLADGARMRLTLDATQLDGEPSPGSVWTAEDATSSSPARQLVSASPLRRIPQLENDPLSIPDLGSGRDHTRVFALTPAPDGEDPLLAVLSLRSDDGVEVRLLRPGLDPAAVPAPPPGRMPLFGLFTLYKQAGACGL